MREISESEIARWHQKNQHNNEIDVLVKAYFRTNELREQYWKEKNGSLYTGASLRRNLLREEIRSLITESQ